MKKLWSIPLIIFVLVAATLWVERSGEVVIPIQDGTLYGTLLEPGKNETGTLIIFASGSGPTDRDGNSGILKGKNDSLKALAYALKKEGIATFRFDQRPSGKTVKHAKLDNISFEVLADDLTRVIREMKSMKKFDRIVLLGHSQGVMVTALAAEGEPVDGLICIAGAARPIDRILLEQLAAAGNVDMKTAERLLGELKAGQELQNVPKELEALFAPRNRNFLATWMQYDPYEVYKKLDLPTLFIYGTRDTQIKPTELTYWKDLAKSGDSVVLEKMNHVLKVIENEEKDSLKSYSDPSYPLHPGLAGAIMGYLGKLTN